MLIDRDVAPFLVFDDEPVETALRRISANHHRIVFVVTSDGVLVGALTDGDFRRWVVEAQQPTLREPCRSIANRACVSVGPDYRTHDVDELFGAGVEVIPILDERGRV